MVVKFQGSKKKLRMTAFGGTVDHIEMLWRCKNMTIFDRKVVTEDEAIQMAIYCLDQWSITGCNK